MTFPKLLKKEIEDVYAQENFKRLEDYFALEAITRANFQFLEIAIPGAVSNLKVLHHLGYTPKDIILLHNFTNAVVTFSYNLFTEDSIYISAGAETTLRFLVGRYV